MKRSEARRLLSALQSRRQDAIDDGDLDALHRLDDEIADLEVELGEADSRVDDLGSEPSRGFFGLGVRGALAVVTCLVLASVMFGDSDDNDFESERGSEAARQSTLAAQRGRAERADRPTESRIRIAAEIALESTAADPDAIDVRTCGVGDSVNKDNPTLPMPYSCDFVGRNAFGGLIAQRADLIYNGVGDADIIRIY